LFPYHHLAGINGEPVNSGLEMGRMKRYAIPGLPLKIIIIIIIPLAGTGIVIISWMGLELVLFPGWDWNC
jgi:hypothetical protein